MSRQRMMHGAEIETATPSEVAEIVAAFAREPAVEYKRFRGVINLNAAGAGQNSVPDDPIYAPPQYDLLLERVAIGGSGAAGAVVELYENDIQSDANLLEVISVAAVPGKYSDSFSNNIYVPANSAVFILVGGGVANLQVTYNIQGRLIKR